MANRPQTPNRPTRKHLAREERERIQRRYLFTVAGAIIGLIVILLIYGYISEGIIKPRQPVAVVNGEEITSGEFQARVRYERSQLVTNWIETYNIVQQQQEFGSADPNMVAYFVNSLNQISFQLDPVPMGREVINQLIADEIIRQEAAERGITVTEAEVDEVLGTYFQYYGGEVQPTATTYPTAQPASTLSPLQLALVTPTPTLTPTATLDPDVEPTPTSTPPPTQEPAPTATPKSEEAFEEEYDNYVDFLKRDVQFDEDDLRLMIESQLYREKLMEVITAELERSQDQVWARHILVGDEETALQVVARLKDGEDFGTLAMDMSTDTGSAPAGGDLGWFPIGQMVPEFERVAFNSDVGQINDPVQSQFGWHVIQVLGHESRSLTASEYDQLRQDVFGEWLDQARQKVDWELFDIWADRVPTDPALPPQAEQAVNELLMQAQQAAATPVVPAPDTTAPTTTP